MIMETNELPKRKRKFAHRNKRTTKTKVYSIRFDLDIEEYINSKPNKNRFINNLIRAAMEAERAKENEL